MSRVLTVPFVDNAKPKRAGSQLVRHEIPDARQPGLYLIVQPSGKKSWAVRYRFGGVPKKLTLGPSPGIDLADARKMASKALTAVAEGHDPWRDKLTAKEAQARAADAEKRGQRDLFENVAREFIERYAKPKAKKKNRPDAWKETARILGLREDPSDIGKLIEAGGDVIPIWRGRKVQEITKREINELLDRIVDRGSPIMANRTLAAIRKLFNWCCPETSLRHPHVQPFSPPLPNAAAIAFWAMTNYVLPGTLQMPTAGRSAP